MKIDIWVFTDGSSTCSKEYDINYGGWGVQITRLAMQPIDGLCLTDHPKILKRGYAEKRNPHNRNYKIYSFSKGYVENNVTNQRMELLAILNGIRKAKTKTKIKNPTILIVTDSMYSLKCSTEWGDKWKSNAIDNVWYRKEGKKLIPVKNQDIVIPLYNEVNDTNANILFMHVLAHKKEPIDKDSVEWMFYNYNNNVDELAKNSARDAFQKYITTKKIN